METIVYLLFILLIGFSIFLQWRRSNGKGSDFEYDEEAIYIGSKKVKISYRNIVAIARDVTRSYRNGTTFYFCYIITCIDADNVTRYISFFKNTFEYDKWEGLKKQATATNPKLIIDESQI